MHTKRLLRVVLFSALLAGALTAGLLWWPTVQSGQTGVTTELVAPPFLGIAKAEDAAVTGVIQDEAGIAAWFDAGTTVDLDQVKSAYRVIETQTADYILGSVPMPGYSEEWHDVHLYVHRDGWFLAYYLNADSIGKIIDWAHFNSGIPTKFETVLASVASSAGLPAPQNVTHYDFRYPNATKLMLLYEDNANGSDFRIKITSNYVYYARSWSVGNAEFWLDGKKLGNSSCGSCTAWGDISATDFAPDVFHSVGVAWNKGVLALLYRDTP